MKKLFQFIRNLFAKTDFDVNDVTTYPILERYKDDYMVTKVAAYYLCITPNYLATLCRKGTIPCAVKEGKYWMIPTDYVQENEAKFIKSTGFNIELENKYLQMIDCAEYIN